MLTYRCGNVIEAAVKEADFLLHGCNCQSTWGAGIAKSLKDAFPNAYMADKKDYRQPHEKIGSYSHHKTKNGLVIINLYTQYDFGRDRSFEYGAFRAAIIEFKRDFCLFQKGPKKVYLPKIGAGLGGGNWEIIEKILASEIIDETDGSWTVFSLE